MSTREDLPRIARLNPASARRWLPAHEEVGRPSGRRTWSRTTSPVHHNLVLHDPAGRLAALRELVNPYPPALGRAIITEFGWEAQFSLDHAVAPARRGDVVHVTGLLYRVVACMSQAIFAHDGRFQGIG